MIELTRAGADDAPALARIHLAARAAAGDAFPPAVHPDEDYLPHLLADVLPRAEVWVVREDREPVGLLVLEDDLLADLYVAPEAQGRGVGTALLAHAKRLRPDGLRLWVFVSNVPAREFYARHGFVVVGGTDGDNWAHAAGSDATPEAAWRPSGGEEGAPDLLLRWPGSAV
jgi:GNAT superfamily N-acetyltransferase